MDILGLLTKLNLNEKEAKVYLACIELGSSKVYQISKKAQLPRSSVYEILEDLRVKGVVNLAHKGKKEYRPVPPDELVAKAKSRLNEVIKALPELKFIFSQNELKPKVRIYEGREGLRIAWEEILETGKKEKRLSAFSTLGVVDSPYFMKFREGRVEEKIFARIIMADSEEAKEYKKKEQDLFMKVKMIPEEYALSLSIDIVGNKTFIISHHKEIITVAIESKEITGNVLKLFNFIWDNIG